MAKNLSPIRPKNVSQSAKKEKKKIGQKDYISFIFNLGGNLGDDYLKFGVAIWATIWAAIWATILVTIWATS